MKNPLPIITMSLFLLLSPMLHSQSIGVSLGSGYSYIAKDLNYTFLDSPLKTALLQYDIRINDNFQLALIFGYTWTGYNDHEVKIDAQFTSITNYEVKSKGVPFEIELQYHHYINSDSIFEPTIGLGIGYLNLKSSINDENNSPYYRSSDLTTKGFTQYISVGLNVHLSKKITSFIEVKKMILNNIKINGSIRVSGFPNQDNYQEDYFASNGLLDVGITLGIAYNFKITHTIKNDN